MDQSLSLSSVAVFTYVSSKLIIDLMLVYIGVQARSRDQIIVTASSYSSYPIGCPLTKLGMSKCYAEESFATIGCFVQVNETKLLPWSMKLE
jgi:hypothetical protein